MDYVEQSLIGTEKIVHIGRFHWVYLAGAFFWIFFGVLICVAIMGAAVAWDVHATMRDAMPSLPAHMFWDGWSDIVMRKGGYIALIRDVPLPVKLGAFGALILGIILFAHMMIVRTTTEIAVTSNRLVLKEGVIARHVDEIAIDRIESVHVIQSVIGRLLDYGTVMVRGMGVGEILLPPVARPIILRNAIEKAKQMHDAGKAR